MRSSNLCRGIPFLQYQKVIQTYGDISGKNISKKLLSEKFSSSKWLYSKNLLGHTGCVNALAFSNNGGEFLVSGGDDTRVLTWKLYEAVTGNTTARCLKQQHHSNILCVTFDNDNRHIITAGNDDVILCHDFESGEAVRSFEANTETHEICIHPEDNHIFIAAESTFGAVTLFDVRTPTEQTVLAVARSVTTQPYHLCQCTKSCPTHFYSARFNPVDPTLIASGNSRYGVQLWDSRFPTRCLKQFDSPTTQQHAMCVAFDQTGRYIVAVRKSLPPVLYHIDRDTCLVEFYDKGYSNSVTRKSVCFAGQKDQFIMTGSENFDIYLWQVPNMAKDYVGVTVEQSYLALKGHRSIVNQVCFNPDTAMVCSSGIEKIIKMWSPFRMVGGISGEREFEKRKMYTRDDYNLLVNGSPLENHESDSGGDSTSEDPQMLALADQWLLNVPQPTELLSSDDESDVTEQTTRDHHDVLLDHSPESTDSASIHAGGSENFPNSGNPDNNSENARNLDSHSENTESRERSSQNTGNTDNNFENAGNSDGNSENTGSRERISQSTGSTGNDSENAGNSDSNSENVGSAGRNSERSDGVGLERLREIIASQDRPSSSLSRIAELRRNCLKE